MISMKITKNPVQARTPTTEKALYSARIMKPMPLLPPKTSVRASTFQAIANP